MSHSWKWGGQDGTAIELTDLVSQTPHDSPLSGGHTPGSDEGGMTPKELTDLCTLLLHKVLDLEKVKAAQEKEIASLKKRVTKLEQRQSSRITGFHPFRAGTSKRHNLGRRKVSKQKMKNLKSQQKFQDIDDLVYEGMNFVLDKDDDTEVIIEDNGSGEKRDKGKGILQEPEPVKKTKKKDQDQIERDAEVALKIQADLDKDARTERERQKEASKATLAEMYNEYTVEEKSKLLAEFFDRRKKQLAKERAEAIRSKPPTKPQLRNLMMTYLKHTGRFSHAQLKSMSFEEIQKLYTREQKWVDAFVPIGSEEDEKRVGSRKKRAVGLSSKQKSPKKQKVNNQESKDGDKELMKCLKVVPDDDKAIDYKTLDVKSTIIDCKSQVLGTNKADDVHVYKLTRLDGSYNHFSTFFRMLEVLDRQDVLDLHKIIMERFPANDLDGYDLILWGDLKTLMESNEDDEI
nr:hypothetical protein [Tanacetum cinerariifolium]